MASRRLSTAATLDQPTGVQPLCPVRRSVTSRSSSASTRDRHRRRLSNWRQPARIRRFLAIDLRTYRIFEVSVDTRTKGRRLDGYTRHRVDDHEVLLDPDLLKLPIELTITTGGLLGRGLSARADGLDGAACPIELL